MNFFEQQDRARAASRRLYVLYALALLGALVTINLVTLGLVHAGKSGRSHDEADESGYVVRVRPTTVRDELPALIGTGLITTAATLLIIGVATAIKVAELGGDGAKLAESLGGRPIVGQPSDLDERKLVNVVEEMSIASGVPMPRLYVMDSEQGINAFAAGTRSEAAVIGVTRGAISQLTRDELQGVIAHEFSHILNGDMRVNLRLIGLNFGLIALGYLGLQTLRWAPQFMSSDSRSSRDDNKGNAGAAIFVAILIIALAMTIVGYVGTLFGKMLQAAVSRQREYLADASAVQFTRNPRGIGGALKKIGGRETGSVLGSPNAGEASHVFFADGVSGWLDSIFATHPPLEQRIRAIDPALLTEPMSAFPVPNPSASPSASVSHAGDNLAALAGFAADGARARAAAAPSPDRFTTSAAALTSVDRGLGASQVDAAARFIDRLPPALLDLAREPYGARAIAIGLLLDADATLRATQLRRVAGVDPALAALVAQHSAAFVHADPRDRLPLLDRALPSLRQLSPTQLATFRTLCQALAEADANVSPFEAAFLTILDGELDLGTTRADADDRRPPPLTSADATDAIATALSALAMAGGEAQATEAFLAGMDSMGLADQRLQRDFDAARFTQALHRLRRATPAIRQRVIEAAARCVVTDGTVAVLELELMRAVAAALKMPIPPLLPAA